MTVAGIALDVVEKREKYRQRFSSICIISVVYVVLYKTADRGYL